MTTPNYALFAIPGYLLVAMLPHVYSVYIVKTNNNNTWDLSSPRSNDNRTHTEKSVPKHIYRAYERSRAAHDNMFESMAFVVGGILTGVFGRLDAGFMNRMCGIYLVSRLLYTVSYIKVTTSRWAPLRTVWYMLVSLTFHQENSFLTRLRLGNVVIMSMYWKVGMVLVRTGILP